jgi:hypothetical protein
MFPHITQKVIERALNKVVPFEARQGKSLSVYHVRSALELTFASDNLYLSRNQAQEVVAILKEMSEDVQPFVNIAGVMAANRSGAARLAGHSVVRISQRFVF